MAREDLLFAALLPLVLIAVFGGVLAVPRILELRRLIRVGQTAVGEVIEAHPESHNTCKYRFMAGRYFEGTGRGCGDAAVGQAIEVHFDPGDPSHSTNVDPERGIVNELVPWGFALVAFPLMTLFGARRRRR